MITESNKIKQFIVRLKEGEHAQLKQTSLRYHVSMHTIAKELLVQGLEAMSEAARENTTGPAR